MQQLKHIIFQDLLNDLVHTGNNKFGVEGIDIKCMWKVLIFACHGYFIYI